MTTRETPEPPRQRRRLTVLSVAAAVLLAGGGGAYWASNTEATDEDQRANAKPDPEPLVLDSHGLAASVNGEDDGRSEVAPGEPNPRGSDYRVSGELPKGPDTAPVFRAREGVSKSEVAAIAAALNVPGTPQSSEGGWSVSADKKDKRGDTGAEDKGPSLTVGNERSSGRWSYSHSPTPTNFQDDEQAVSAAKAKSVVRPVLRALDLGQAELDASSAHDGLRVVNVQPRVGDLPTQDWGGSFTVGPDGELLRGHGQSGQPTKGDAYPVMTAEQTLKQLPKRGPIGIAGNGCLHTGSPSARDGKAPQKAETLPSTLPSKSKSDAADGAEADAKRPADAPCATPTDEKPRTVTAAEFGLDTQYSEGQAVLVPSWTYEVRQGDEGEPHEVTHPAVEPKYLKSPNDGSQGEKPGRDKTAPGESPDEKDKRRSVTSYDAADRTLTLTFWGGVCHAYKGSAEASGKQVKVSVKAGKSDTNQPCVAIAKKQQVKVTLDKPLGDREVVDARDGESLPKSE